MDASDERELRVLRRVFASKNTKAAKNLALVRVEGRISGIQPKGRVTLTLHEIPHPDSPFATDIADIMSVALRHAEERRERLGYSKLLGVFFDGKAWQAKLEI